MSAENVEVVRMPLRVGEPSSRTLEQRLALRFPRLVDAYARRVLRLGPSSRVRQAVVGRAMRQTLEAYNRRDTEAYLTLFDRDARYEVGRESAEMGMYESSFPIHDGLRRFWAEMDDAWGRVQVYPREVVDLGDRVVMLGEIKGQGVRSGAPVSVTLATVSTIRDGKVVNIREFATHAEALAAVGLSE